MTVTSRSPGSRTAVLRVLRARASRGRPRLDVVASTGSVRDANGARLDSCLGRERSEGKLQKRRNVS